jgi:hypothetical protein
MSQESVDPTVGDVDERVDTTGLPEVSSEVLPPRAQWIARPRRLNLRRYPAAMC